MQVAVVIVVLGMAVVVRAAFNTDGQAVQSVSDGFTVNNRQPHLAFVR